jgi:hypothetical protein
MYLLHQAMSDWLKPELEAIPEVRDVNALFCQGHHPVLEHDSVVTRLSFLRPSNMPVPYRFGSVFRTSIGAVYVGSVQSRPGLLDFTLDRKDQGTAVKGYRQKKVMSRRHDRVYKRGSAMIRCIRMSWK